ncbi:MAG TPA: HNH endonuclease [bacterium]|jgi:5-methylcytosine-specific restriction endonuclease McrA|nr:HNH endonuclease [bacterium]HNT66785.1 HNH endonuclease [bacterium]HOX86829.1 HNH endonuclease [bacterium]HPG46984.1 HNH endonuclease [bacterium]HPM99248.1 HNH endonuclease [bacterium]
MLSHKVLLLNQNYEPIMVLTAKKAIVLIYMQKVEIVEKHPLKVQSLHYSMPLPSVVRLLYFVQIPYKRVELTRRNILKRDGYRCQYCRTTQGPLTVDHVVPRTKGGTDTWENLVCACIHCNNRKGNRTPEQTNMKLARQPRRPNHLFFIQRFVAAGEQLWKPYLFFQ